MTLDLCYPVTSVSSCDVFFEEPPVAGSSKASAGPFWFHCRTKLSNALETTIGIRLGKLFAPKASKIRGDFMIQNPAAWPTTGLFKGVGFALRSLDVLFKA